MRYYSTRDNTLRITASEAVKMGLSRDGGLLTPEAIPQIDEAFLRSLMDAGYQTRAAKVMALYLTDYSEEELLGFANNAYGPDKFDHPAAAPLRKVDGNTYCLELWHGPTSAFKDMALQMLPQLLSAALRKTGEDKTAFWWPRRAIPARRLWRALPMCPRRKSWYSIPKTAFPQCRRPRWSLRTAKM